MTDKQIFVKDINVPRKEQIIIDGVDVSRCKFFNDITESYYCFAIPCKDRPNCYFKQLARKTQECEEMEIAIKIKDQRIEDYRNALDNKTKQLNRYRQALDKIAEHYEKVIKNLTTYDEVYDANISIEALHNISDIINQAKGEE